MGENDQPTGGNPGAAEDLEKASLETVYEKLATSAKGLASAEAKQRLDKYGKPVCSGIAPPSTAVGPFKSGSIIGDPV